jgi:hypothetical protein
LLRVQMLNRFTGLRSGRIICRGHKQVSQLNSTSTSVFWTAAESQRNLFPFHAMTSTWPSKPDALPTPVFFDKNNSRSFKCGLHCEYRILRNLSPLPFKIDNCRKA